jgi:hypothetical protein
MSSRGLFECRVRLGGFDEDEACVYDVDGEIEIGDVGDEPNLYRVSECLITSISRMVIDIENAPECYQSRLRDVTRKTIGIEICHDGMVARLDVSHGRGEDGDRLSRMVCGWLSPDNLAEVLQ